ncbi:hypothetical protein M6B38_322475 [Iris pallida]|uniref:Uncharacterized protein n=1 Tax=Iris pallida TaxID=29817 RepID=A0AAX6HBI1_IRIPA|nr:hypothetical protein M6B38_322475 [Iris pallida]
MQLVSGLRTCFPSLQLLSGGYPVSLIICTFPELGK